MRFLRRLFAGIALLLLVFAVAALASRRNGDRSLFPPRDGERSITVTVTAGTYHAGLVMPVAELIAAAEKTRHGEVIGIATRFAAYPYVEIGWGDEGFDRLVPTLPAPTAAEAPRA